MQTATPTLTDGLKWSLRRPKEQRLPMARRTSGQGRGPDGPQTTASKLPADQRQRVTIKVSYVSGGAMKAQGRTLKDAMDQHLGYLGREGAGIRDGLDPDRDKRTDREATRPNFFDMEKTYERVSPPEFKQIKGEQRFYKFIISPEHGSKLDLKEYTRAVLKSAEEHLGQRLQWTAAEHRNTDNPHVHVVVRGVDHAGQHVDFRKHPEFVKTHLRESARDIATGILGRRTEPEIRRQQQRDLTALRVTGLDQVIAKRTRDGQALQTKNPQVSERLAFLARMGLADRKRGNSYQLKDGWMDRLKEEAKRGDIIKNMNYRGRGLSFVDKTTNVSGQVVRKEVTNELTERSGVVLRTAGGKDYYYDGIETRSMRVGAPIEIKNGQARAPQKDQNQDLGRERSRERKPE